MPTDTGIPTPVTPLTITRDNVHVVTGLSWAEVVKLCERFGIPVLRISHKRRAIDGAAFMAAIRQAAATAPTPKAADEVDQLLIDLGIKRR